MSHIMKGVASVMRARTGWCGVSPCLRPVLILSLTVTTETLSLHREREIQDKNTPWLFLSLFTVLASNSQLSKSVFFFHPRLISVFRFDIYQGFIFHTDKSNKMCFYINRSYKIVYTGFFPINKTIIIIKTNHSRLFLVHSFSGVMKWKVIFSQLCFKI